MRSGISIRRLISLPPASAAFFNSRRAGPDRFAASDPPGRKLGSGGGAARLIAEAWRQTGEGRPFGAWLRESPSLVVLGGGQSRRLPAYAAIGKPLIPIPILRWSWGQRLDQTLLDLQVEAYERVLRSSPAAVAMIASGDVLLRFAPEIPPLPPSDVVMLGMRVEPETASHFGVFFCSRERPGQLEFFLQKPSPRRIEELAAQYDFLVDTGMWLFGERAAEALLRRCGWIAGESRFAGGEAQPYELYAQFGLSLGRNAAAPDAELQALSAAVVDLPDPEFYHLGASRQLIDSVWALQNRTPRQTCVSAIRSHPNQIAQNAIFDPPIRQALNHTLWIENSHVPASWRLACEHVLTGVPENDWRLSLEPGVCLDFAPIGRSEHCLRFYGMDDSFSGEIGAEETAWLGRPAPGWFRRRAIGLEAAGIPPSADIQTAPLFPVLPAGRFSSEFIQWLYAADPPSEPAFAELWLASPRLSAEQIAERANLRRLEQSQERLRLHSFDRIYEHRESSVFRRLDLESAAELFAASPAPLPEPSQSPADPLLPIHEQMWRAAVLRRRGLNGDECERMAFEALSKAILSAIEHDPVLPRLDVMPDQIVWGRAPARLDLAGGWTDTPPYCLLHGGAVTNIAVELNGQPPIQAFALLREKPEIIVRSIDMGAQETIRTYEELDTFAQPGSAFGLAKAALALAGFLPRFHAGGGYASLEQQLRDFGGGIEVSLLAAIPSGSGLGTSSILAATALGALSNLCGLHWSQQAIIGRTLALEQMMTTGGGWQDQVGGVLRGAKLAETAPGLNQTASIKWLPETLFREEYANRTMLLYYTGLTRLAKNILGDIVRGMFLNSARRLPIVQAIGRNAYAAAEAIQRVDWDGLCAAVRRSWELNQSLDEGTNPPAVQAILAPIADYLSACKLLGAGGGGYMLMLAKDEEAAHRIRRRLADSPPNSRARFVEMRLSSAGLEITRS